MQTPAPAGDQSMDIGIVATPCEGPDAMQARVDASLEAGSWVLRIRFMSRANRERFFVARTSALDLATSVAAHLVARAEGVAASTVTVRLRVHLSDDDAS